ncbi:hypothetical protein VST7929_01209 [Vibrio stylophorae]|uniref:Permease n=1 Tax=Vibrio stylophorae TaxID=659351 RepID=A0ABM8ZSS1_9VIBR|nr:permease [Vibrio stylophorae]CAH0533343.1 hypothetical protein VST7929_01209 [Vibrio stylophorae]
MFDLIQTHHDAIVDTLKLFAFLAIELSALFLLISFAVAALQRKIPPKKIEAILSSRNGRGYFIAALLGAITPFCSCSTIPFLKGLLRARASMGSVLVFLFASPLLNPIIIALFAATLGLKVTVFYFVIAMGVSIAAGFILEKLGFERFVKPEVYAPVQSCCASTCGSSKDGSTKAAPVSVWRSLWQSTWQDFVKVAPYLLLGISIGALIYGFLPTEWIASVASDNNPFAIPVAAIIGIPLYIRAEAVIPLSAALVSKGMGLGTVMALIIGSAGASLTEVILLKSLFKTQLIVAFVTVILAMAMLAGWLYPVLF